MKRGEAAREAVKNKIAEAFGADYVGCVDKKLYVEVEDGPGGEKLQFAISMAIPKATISRGAGAANNSTSDGGWSGPVVAAAPPTEISDSDKAKVAELMAKLGLNEE